MAAGSLTRAARAASRAQHAPPTAGRALSSCPAPATPTPAPAPQFPTKAADARGDIGRRLPTLEEEYRRIALERALDTELERIAKRKAQQQPQGK